MNPDKLFDYLDGKLPPGEREQLEEKLMSEEHLRREFNVAREIHRGGGLSREIIVSEDVERGGRLGRRIAIVAIALVFANVIGGLSFIAFKNKKSSASRSGEEAVRRQVASSIGAAVEHALPVPTFVPADIKIAAPRAEWENVASRVIAAATTMGGEARKGLPNEDMMMVLADIPSAREAEFRLAVNSTAAISPPPATGQATAVPIDPNQRSIVQVRIAEVPQ